MNSRLAKGIIDSRLEVSFGFVLWLCVVGDLSFSFFFLFMFLFSIYTGRIGLGFLGFWVLNSLVHFKPTASFPVLLRSLLENIVYVLPQRVVHHRFCRFRKPDYVRILKIIPSDFFLYLLLSIRAADLSDKCFLKSMKILEFKFFSFLSNYIFNVNIKINFLSMNSEMI